jgi:hypothetical protein
MAEKTTVKMFSKELDETREFDIAHATRILKHQGDKGITGSSAWELADNNFELKDGAITPTGTGQDSKTGRSSRNQ